MNMRPLVRLLALAAAMAVAAFALANRQPVAISFAPLPWAMESGLWLVALAFFAGGALLGGLFVWAGAHDRRRRGARRHRRAGRLADELAAARRHIALPENGAAAGRSVARTAERRGAPAG